MMYCDRCNIDFSEGLRYCKWCGQTLVERRRDTNELKSCPACSAAIQPAWAFCKACGAQLGEPEPPEATAGVACPRCGAATDSAALNCQRCGQDLTEGREPHRITNVDATQAMTISHCPSCGEAVDSGSPYCKACGSALYAQPVTPGPSALLCSVCHSVSPLGSASCRVCGALLIETEVGLANRAGEPASMSQQKSSTLADHLPETEIVDRRTGSHDPQPQPESDDIESGAHTLIFTDSNSAELKNSVAEQPATFDTDSSAAPGKATNLLPGVAGSQFEQPTPTTAFNQTRITGPVDPESSEAEPARDTSVEMDAPPAASVTRIALDSFPANEAGDARISQGTSVLGSEADLRDTGSQLSAHRTVVFGSGSPEEEDDSAAPEWDEGGPMARGEIMTAPFAMTPPHVEQEKAAETQVISEMRPGLNASTAQEATVPERPAESPLRTNKEIEVVKVDSPAAIAQPVAEKKKSNAPIIAVAALVIVALAVGLVWLMSRGKQAPEPPQAPPVAQEPAATPPATPAPPETPPAKPVAPAAPEGMVMVEGGPHIIGRDDADPLEKPRRTITLPPFFIDRTEVTNADYKKFLDATRHEPPPNWKGGTYPEGKDNYPVTSVTWQDASDYAAWAGKRLPTEAEWEAAARGSDGRLYPWGNEWQPALGNIGLKPKDVKSSEYASDIKQVGQYSQGASPAGALDMIGNVWEWTADKFALYEGGINKLPDHIKIDPAKVYRVIRGGAFDGSKIHDASYRGLLDASQPYPKVGFRCVKDATSGRQ
jgi:formylglycine-generating enzyme required for sulfatase activity